MNVLVGVGCMGRVPGVRRSVMVTFDTWTNVRVRFAVVPSGGG